MMKNLRSFFLVYLVCGIATVFAQAPGDISYMSSGGPLHPLQAKMDIKKYKLSLDVNIEKQSINGSLEAQLLVSQSTDTLMFDLYKGYTVANVLVGGKNFKFEQKGDAIYIIKPDGFSLGRHVVRIFYGGVPPIAVRPPWKGGFTWTKDKDGNPWVAINCQLEGGKVYFPCKDHPSDEPDEGVELEIRVPKGLSVAGPGLLQRVKQQGQYSTWFWKTNYTISNYCIVFNVGKYKVVEKTYTTVEGNKVPVQFYVLEHDVDKAEKIVDMRMRDARILEKYFGEYPWVKEKMGIAQVPNPGMEHQTMISYGDAFTFSKVGALDYSPNLYHEFGHEWWANKITNKDWAHMWIQEGINTYAEALFFREAAGERGYDSLMVSIHNGIRNAKPIVLTESLDMANVYNGDVYTKGAFLMHTLRKVMGDEQFFASLKEFITQVKFPYQEFFVTEDLVKYFSTESGRDLKPLFDFYLRTTNRMEFNIRQTKMGTYEVEALSLPIDLKVDILTSKGVEVFEFKAGKNKPIKLISTQLPVIDPRGWYFKKVTVQ